MLLVVCYYGRKIARSMRLQTANYCIGRKGRQEGDTLEMIVLKGLERPAQEYFL